MKQVVKKPILLAILDGWGVAPASKSNAVTTAKMTYVQYLKNKYPWVLADASGDAVGLPVGQMGNSEVGHLHIGAGRIRHESLYLINEAVANNTLKNNQPLLDAIEYAKTHNKRFHLLGLFSDGGVHSHINHTLAIYRILVENGIKEIYFHLIGDGRDTKPKVFLKYLAELQTLIDHYQVGKIATISGRYFTMDRDKRFDRSQRAFDNLVFHRGRAFNDPTSYINKQYLHKIGDEFLEPGYNSQYEDSTIQNHDVVFFTNFRPDRAIQISSGFTNPYYTWKPQPFLADLYFLTMTKYSDHVKTNHICFPPSPLVNCLGEWISKHQLHQLRMAETEKIAHVTFFLDGGTDYFDNGMAEPHEVTLPLAAINLIPSPKVETYDLQPEMSAYKITSQLLVEIDKNIYDLIVVNFANGDMVGHTGSLPATIKANQVLDKCLRQIYNKIIKAGGILIITADHGNCEVMVDPDGGVNKKHTTNKVPIIITEKGLKLRTNAKIADIAPTILELMQLEQPPEMTQTSLIVHHKK